MRRYERKPAQTTAFCFYIHFLLDPEFPHFTDIMRKLCLTSPSPGQLNCVSLTVHVDAQQAEDTVTGFPAHSHNTPN